MKPLKRWVVKLVRPNDGLQYVGLSPLSYTTLDKAKVFNDPKEIDFTIYNDEKLIRYESELCFGW